MSTFGAEDFPEGKLDKSLITGMLGKQYSGNLYKLSVGSNGAKIVVDCFETKSRQELNFDKIKSYLGMMVAD